MTTWRDRYPDYGIDNAQSRLQSAGYHLVNDEQAGVWLVSKLGSVWYPDWRAAYAAADSGRGALDRVAGRVTK